MLPLKTDHVANGNTRAVYAKNDTRARARWYHSVRTKRSTVRVECKKKKKGPREYVVPGQRTVHTRTHPKYTVVYDRR